MTEETFKPSQLIREAKRELQERGWVKSAFISTKGCVCADGALQLASGAFKVLFGKEDKPLTIISDLALFSEENAVRYDVYRVACDKYVQDAVDEFTQADDPELDGSFSVISYNDAVAENVDDIYRLFDRAIELAEADGR